MAMTGKVREITEDVVVDGGGKREAHGRGSEEMIPRQNRPAEVSSRH